MRNQARNCAEHIGAAARAAIVGAALIGAALVLPGARLAAAQPGGPRTPPGNVAHFAASARCFGDGRASPSDACDFLRTMVETDLAAPPGGRAYRETWSGPFRGDMHAGAIVVTIDANGRRSMKTPWRTGAFRLRPKDLPDFEDALAHSDFGALPMFNQYAGVCVDGVATSLEAVVDGKYRLVYFDYCGGVSSESVALALDRLFVFAARKSGRHYPVNPDHPTFRG